MELRKLSAAFGAMLVMAPTFAHATGDPVAGQTLSQANCARCHDIGQQGQTGARATGFAEIAADWPEDRIDAYLFPVVHASARGVVRIELTREEADDITAYILSLETER